MSYTINNEHKTESFAMRDAYAETMTELVKKTSVSCIWKQI